MKVHEAVAMALGDLGTEILFGLMGDANMAYVAEYSQHPGRRYVAAMNEASAVSMAVGYARLSGRVGVATITHGPGFTNAATAMTEAVRSRTPVVIVTGSPMSARRDHPQIFDLEGLAVLAGASFNKVRAPGYLVDDLRSAFRTALAHSTVVVVDVPVDLLMEEMSYEPPKEIAPRALGSIPDPEGSDLDQCLGILASARRPLILAGRGAALADARASLLRLGEQLGAVLGTSLLGKDLFRGEAFDIDMLGPMGTTAANRIAGLSDCIIAFGAELNRHTTGGGSLLEGRPVIQVDVDQARIGRFGSVDVGLVGDARLVADQLSAALEAIDHVPSRSYRTDEVRREIEGDAFAARPVPAPVDGTVDMRTAMRALNETLPTSRQVVTDCGRFVYAPWRFLNVESPLDIAHALNFTSIGLGLSTGLGAAFARQDRVTVIVCGDGGAGLSLMEFRTAVSYGLRVILVVLNDGCYGAEFEKLPTYGLSQDASMLDFPDFAPLAEALGGSALTVRTRNDLERALELCGSDRFPLLLDVKSDPTVDVAAD